MRFLKAGLPTLIVVLAPFTVGLWYDRIEFSAKDMDSPEFEESLDSNRKVVFERTKNAIRDQIHKTTTGKPRLPDRDCKHGKALVIEDVVLDVLEEGTTGFVGKGMCEMVLENVTIRAKTGIVLDGISWAVLRNVTIVSEGPALDIRGQSKAKIIGGSFTSTTGEAIKLKSASRLTAKGATFISHEKHPVIRSESLSEVQLQESKLAGARKFHLSSMGKVEMDKATEFTSTKPAKPTKKKRKKSSKH